MWPERESTIGSTASLNEHTGLVSGLRNSPKAREGSLLPGYAGDLFPTSDDADAESHRSCRRLGVATALATLAALVLCGAQVWIHKSGGSDDSGQQFLSKVGSAGPRSTPRSDQPGPKDVEQLIVDPWAALSARDSNADGALEGGEISGAAAGLQERFNVSRAEFREALLKADGNSDGKLTKPEVKAFVVSLMRTGNWTPRLFHAGDRDGDGVVVIDKLEVPWWAHHFGVDNKTFQASVKKADADVDGKLTVGEFRDMMAQLLQDRHYRDMVAQPPPPPPRPLDGRLDDIPPAPLDGKGATGLPPPPGYHDRGAAPMPQHSAAAAEARNDLIAENLEQRYGVDEATYKELFEQADTDGDGKLQPQEFHTLLGRLMQAGNWTPLEFNATDANGDGKLAGSELKKLAGMLQRRFAVNRSEYTALAKAADDEDGSLEISEVKSLMGSLQMDSAPRRLPPPLGAPAGMLPLPSPPTPQFGLAPLPSHAGRAPGVEGQDLDQLAKHLEQRFGVDEQDFDDMFAEVDEDSDGRLVRSEVHELIKLMMQKGNRTPPQMVAADENGDPEVAGDELARASHLLSSLLNLNGSRTQALLSSADADDDEHFNVPEFKSFLDTLMRESGDSRQHMLPPLDNGLAREGTQALQSLQHGSTGALPEVPEKPAQELQKAVDHALADVQAAPPPPPKVQELEEGVAHRLADAVLAAPPSPQAPEKQLEQLEELKKSVADKMEDVELPAPTVLPEVEVAGKASHELEKAVGHALADVQAPPPSEVQELEKGVAHRLADVVLTPPPPPKAPEKQLQKLEGELKQDVAHELADAGLPPPKVPPEVEVPKKSLQELEEGLAHDLAGAGLKPPPSVKVDVPEKPLQELEKGLAHELSSSGLLR